MTTTPCDHEKRVLEGLRVVACAGCGTTEWWSKGRRLDPAEGMARLFGRFDLRGRLPAIQAPGPEALMYEPPDRRSRSHLDAFPSAVWLEVDTDLWMSHDGERLLLVPTTPLLMENLTRGA